MNDRDEMIESLKESIGSKPSGKMSMDEIMQAIHEVARDSQDRDRFKALKMLASTDTSAVVLDAPMTDTEILERLQRVMKPAGKDLSQIAYKRAFPHARDLGMVIDIKPSELTEEQKQIVLKVRTLKQLYKMFPEVKRHGFPTGYPMGKGLEVQQAWCRKRAEKILIDRDVERQKLEADTDRLIRESSEKDEANAKEAPEPSPEIPAQG